METRHDEEQKKVHPKLWEEAADLLAQWFFEVIMEKKNDENNKK